MYGGSGKQKVCIERYGGWMDRWMVSKNGTKVVNQRCNKVATKKRDLKI